MAGLKEFDFHAPAMGGLLITAGGFEDRSATFVSRLAKSRCHFDAALALHYLSQKDDNEPNFERINSRLRSLLGKAPDTVSVDANSPIQSFLKIRSKIEDIAEHSTDRIAYIDISGMTHLWTLGALHACLSSGYYVHVIYSEAQLYFPLKSAKEKLVRFWREHEYERAGKYLQSAAVKAVHIMPEFGGNFRPGRPTCLIVFVGYEPNRTVGLVDGYAPGALVVFYGRSPHQELQWRTELSRELHEELFSQWHVREAEISTLVIDDILAKLEDEFQVIREQYDVAIAVHCSKMQGIASYLFWRRHPEVQLLFTSPVRFNPDRYSRGAGRTFEFEIG